MMGIISAISFCCSGASVTDKMLALATHNAPARRISNGDRQRLDHIGNVNRFEPIFPRNRVSGLSFGYGAEKKVMPINAHFLPEETCRP